MQKEILEHGIALFNKKPRAGLEYLQQRGLLATDVRSIAEFLHKDDDRLDRTVIGDFLGMLLRILIRSILIQILSLKQTSQTEVCAGFFT